jgi:hypothetical protein
MRILSWVVIFRILEETKAFGDRIRGKLVPAAIHELNVGRHENRFPALRESEVETVVDRMPDGTRDHDGAVDQTGGRDELGSRERKVTQRLVQGFVDELARPLLPQEGIDGLRQENIRSEKEKILVLEERDSLLAPGLVHVPFDRDTCIDNDESHRRARSSRMNATDSVSAFFA